MTELVRLVLWERSCFTLSRVPTSQGSWLPFSPKSVSVSANVTWIIGLEINTTIQSSNDSISQIVWSVQHQRRVQVDVAFDIGAVQMAPSGPWRTDSAG